MTTIPTDSADIGFMGAPLFGGLALTLGVGTFALQPWVDRRFPSLRWLK